MSTRPEGAPADKPAATKTEDTGGDASWLTAIEGGIDEIATQPPGVLFVDVLKIDLPYIIMLSMAVLGIGHDGLFFSEWLFV